MDALDSSVCIPALADWHEDHDATRRHLVGSAVPAHALLETYSVLTRLPEAHRISPEVVRRALVARFPPTRVLTGPADLQRRLVMRLADAGIAGGAVYDGLVGMTAAAHGVTLLTRDTRAVHTYEALGVPYRLL